jgi:hypothetical protein
MVRREGEEKGGEDSGRWRGESRINEKRYKLIDPGSTAKDRVKSSTSCWH